MGVISILSAALLSGTIALRTVAIDAGHGGTDPGAVSKDKKTYEKTLTLDISKRLGALIEEGCPDVKVIYTRPNDVRVDLVERAKRANRANADLFISIHINSTKSTSPNGYSLHLLGKSSDKNRDLFAYNMDVCRRENEVISLEEDSSTKYNGFDPSDPESFIFMQLMQNAYLEQSMMFAQDIYGALDGGPVKHGRGIWQNPFLVLWKTSMPAVLAELGFISNDADLAVLRDPDKRQKLAECLYQAFVAYKARYDSSVDISAPASRPASPAPASRQPAAPAPSKPAESLPAEAKPADSGAKPAESLPAAPATEQPAPAELFGVQIFAGSTLLQKTDSRFLGYSPEIVAVPQSANVTIYKYVIGVSGSLDEAKSHLLKIRAKYPGSFLVKISEGKTNPVK